VVVTLGFTCLSLVVALLFLGVRHLKMIRELDREQVERSRVQALVDSIPDLTWIKDCDSKFLMVNRQFSRVFGVPAEDIVGKTDMDLSDEEQAKRYMADDQLVMTTRDVLHREERITGPGGFESWAETVKVPVIGPRDEVVGTAGIARDISERKLNEKKMRHLAHHDALTDLPNRVLLEMQVKFSLDDHDPLTDQMLVMFIDLDNFKIINDTINHNVGDQVLIELATRLSRVVRKEDIVARIGGDEFVLVFPFTHADQAEELAAKVQSALSKPIAIEDMFFETTMSIGISCYPRDGEDCWTLVQHADMAMYHAKQSGKNQAAIFSRQLADHSIRKMTIDSRIEDALVKNEFEVFYQPKVDLISWQIIGVEALMRWQDNVTKHWLLPEEFIPAAERSGFIVKLGEWLIDEVARQLAQWQREGIALPVSINISAAQIHQNRINDSLKDGLAQYGVDGRLLELELTERVVMENADSIIANLGSLSDQGITVSIDDFGTGYSNLAFLSRFPISSLKIDRSFVHNIDSEKERRQVAGTIVEMAKSMELKVIAEGVEREEELSTLLALGVDVAQGFLFDRPLRRHELESRLHKHWRYRAQNGENRRE